MKQEPAPQTPLEAGSDGATGYGWTGGARLRSSHADIGTAGGTRPKKSWVTRTRMVIFGPGKFYLENDDVSSSRRNDYFKRKETP